MIRQFLQKHKKIKSNLAILVALIVFLVIFVFVQIGKAAWNEACLNNQKIYTNSYLVTEKNTYLGDAYQREGEVVFNYYGREADCYRRENSSLKATCFENYPYGLDGTMVLGGNLVLHNSLDFGFLGEDSVGFHWLMTSAKEPIGNAVGFDKKNNLIQLGDNLIINKDMKINNPSSDTRQAEVYFLGVSQNLNNTKLPYIIRVDYPLTPIYKDVRALSIRDGANNPIIEVLEKPVCGDGCLCGAGGDSYGAIANKGVNIKGLLMASNSNINIEVPGPSYYAHWEFPANTCDVRYRKTEYRADEIKNFYNFYDRYAGEYAGHLFKQPLSPDMDKFYKAQDYYKFYKVVDYEVIWSEPELTNKSVGIIQDCSFSASCFLCTDIYCNQDVTTRDATGRCP